MSSMCGAEMMIFGLVARVVDLGLIASLMILVWVAIGRLRREARPTVS